jgi:hypothetical protein
LVSCAQVRIYVSTTWVRTASRRRNFVQQETWGTAPCPPDGVAPAAGVGGEHSMVDEQVDARSWHERGQLLQQLSG